MSGRYRLNLEAPFREAGGWASQQPRASDSSGLQLSAGAEAADARSSETDLHLRRPPVPQRPKVDYGDEAIARYVNGLEARMVAHIRKHAPQWHQDETKRILRRWSAPAANHPAPGWAPPRDVLADAHDYAAIRLGSRLAERMNRIGDIRMTRNLSVRDAPEPLHQIFHSRSSVLQQRRKLKI